MTNNGAATVRSKSELVLAIEAGAQPEYLFFWGHRAKGPGLGSWCLSQWWASPFDIDGTTFQTAEHFMMWSKAVLFNDHHIAQQILDSDSPGKAKALGRMIAGFNEAVWVDHRWDIVMQGSRAKFGSDPRLTDYLRSTGKRVLVEASPMDSIWGIGLSKDSPQAAEPQKWNGLNLLGFALMETRNSLP